MMKDVKVETSGVDTNVTTFKILTELHLRVQSLSVVSDSKLSTIFEHNARAVFQALRALAALDDGAISKSQASLEDPWWASTGSQRFELFKDKKLPSKPQWLVKCGGVETDEWESILQLALPGDAASLEVQRQTQKLIAERVAKWVRMLTTQEKSETEKLCVYRRMRTAQLALYAAHTFSFAQTQWCLSM